MIGISPNAVIQWEVINWVKMTGLEYYEEIEWVTTLV
jgi:hypothetical protein